MNETDSESGRHGTLLILAASLLWGTTGTSQALAPAGVNPIALGEFRMVIGGSSLLLVALARRSFPVDRPWPVRPALVAGLFVALYQLSFFAAVAATGVAVGTMVAIGSSPIAAGLLGYLVRKERPGRVWGAATLLAIAGCTLLAAGGGRLEASPYGIALALLAGFAYAAYTVSMKGLLDWGSPDAAMALVFCCAAILLAPLLFFCNLEWALTLRGAAIILHLGLFATAASYLLFARGLKSVPVGTAATLSLGEPLTAALLGVAVLGERLGRWQLFGILLLFAGIAVLTLAPGRRKPSSSGRKP